MKFVWETPEEIDKALAQRLSRIRKRRNLSQQALSEKSNVSYGSIKRFETTGADFAELADKVVCCTGLRG